MAEEKSNLEPLEEGDLDLKAKFSGVAKPKKPENVIAEVKENPVPKLHEREEQQKVVSRLEPLEDKDLNPGAKFSGVTPEKSEESAQVPEVKKPVYEFPRMSIMKKETPVSVNSEAGEEHGSNANFSNADQTIGTEKIIEEAKKEVALSTETGAEKKEDIPEEQEGKENLPRMTISHPTVDKSISEDARLTAQERDVSNKVETLVRLAETKGIAHATKVAQHLDDNYTMDEFHDYLLTEELREALVQRGLIREI